VRSAGFSVSLLNITNIIYSNQNDGFGEEKMYDFNFAILFCFILQCTEALKSVFMFIVKLMGHN